MNTVENSISNLRNFVDNLEWLDIEQNQIRGGVMPLEKLEEPHPAQLHANEAPGHDRHLEVRHKN